MANSIVKVGKVRPFNTERDYDTEEEMKYAQEFIMLGGGDSTTLVLPTTFKEVAGIISPVAASTTPVTALIESEKNGTLATQTLTVSLGATAAGTITLVLDGVSVPLEVALTDDTAAEVATKINAAVPTSVSDYWTVAKTDAVILFTAKTKEVKTGIFSFTDTDTTGAAGAFVAVAGVVPTTTSTTFGSDFVYDPNDVKKLSLTFASAPTAVNQKVIVIGYK